MIRTRFVSHVLLTTMLISLPSSVLTAGDESEQTIPPKFNLQRISLEDRKIIPTVPNCPPVLTGVDATESITPLWIFDGEAPADIFGYSVAGAGDVDSDGCADLIVGAFWRDGLAGVDAGKVYVYSGLIGGLLWSFDGQAAGDWFGQSVAGAGDVNKDGYADLIVGAPWRNGQQGNNVGKAYVYSGKTGLPLLTFDGEAAYDYFGQSVAGAGDVNMDGYADLIVGAYNHDGPVAGVDAGRAYVYSGFDGASLWSFDGEAVNDWFGNSVAGAGDVNKDDYPDLIVGAYYHDGPGGVNAGKAYVYSGKTGLQLFSFNGQSAYDNLGNSVSGAGDVNKDGNADLIVGANTHDGPGGNAAGKAYVYSGSTGLVLWSFDGEAADDRFGQSVAGAGDVNKDGYADLIVGAYLHHGPAGADAGRAYVFSGRNANLLWAFNGEAADDRFGWSVSGAGDVNKDGYNDLIAGAELHDAAGNNAGRAYVFSGRGIGCRTVSPAPCETDVTQAIDVTSVFDIEMNGATITSSSVFVSGDKTGVHAGALTYDSPSLSMLFNPTDDFVPGEVVTCTMTDALTTTSGYPLESCVWQFTTKAAKGSGVFDPPLQYYPGNGPFSVVSADFDGDGDLDLATANYLGDNIRVSFNNGSGSYVSAYTGTINDPRGICAADFDRDGDVDIAVTNSLNDQIGIFKNTGSGNVYTLQTRVVGDYPYSIVAADLNADGWPDLATANPDGDNITVVLNNAGDLTSIPPVNYNVLDNPRSIAAGDLDNDGDLDLVVAAIGSGCVGSVAIRWNDGKGAFPMGTGYMGSILNNCPIAVTTADFDGDGDLDLGVALNSAANLGIIENEGAGVFSITHTYPADIWPFSVVGADFDADGDLDLASGNSGGDNATVVLLNGLDTYTSTDYPAGNSPFGLTAGDLNGDGAMDLAVANYDVDSVSVLLNIVSPCDCGVWGDVSGEGQINPVDVVKMVNFVYKSNDTRVQPPDCPKQAGDANCSGAVNPVDVVLYVNYVYKSNQSGWCANPCGP